MEWVILNPSSIHETFGLLGFVGSDGAYSIRDTCQDGLTDLLAKLENDGQYLRTRRCLGATEVIRKDLIPLLTRAGSDSPKLLPKVIKLLSQLTLPTECLVNQQFSETEEGQQITYELESLLRNVKHEFSRFKATQVVIEFLKYATQKTELTPEDRNAISDGILLLRNILHITVKDSQIQYQILWNLFAHNIDKLLIHLMTCEEKHWWSMSVVQLISLIYKDQHITGLQKLLMSWLEHSASESSEDNESNTSPKHGNSAPLLFTSDPTSDSSDNGGNHQQGYMETSSTNPTILPPPVPTSKHYSKVKKVKPHRHIDADSGVSFNESQEENTISKVQDSNSSNEDNSKRPTRKGTRISHPSAQEKLKKKMHRRIKSNRPNLKQHHHPTEEDVSHILREFTVRFLLKGYGSFVALLEEQLSNNPSITMDKSHFLWLITYFLKFASQLELDVEAISPVLSFKILSYLTFEGVVMCENLAICKGDLKPHLRRMHLLVTSLREFVLAVEAYSKIPSEDETYMNTLQSQIIECRELRFLFLLLIRAFTPGVHSKQYLSDVITTNHSFLLLLERISNTPECSRDFEMMDFIQEYTHPTIMQQYGHLLEDFQKNGEKVNDCIFTMMHHVAGDLSLPDVLFHPLILKTFSNIWEVEFELRDDWADLIEFVIQRFMKASKDEKRLMFKSGTSNISEETGFTKEDIENLYWYYTKGTKTSDPIGTILAAYKPSETKTRESVLNQLLHQRIIGYNQFLQFLSCERVDSTTELISNDGSGSMKDPTKFNYFSSGMESNKMVTNSSSVEGDVSDMLKQLRSDGFDAKWIQEQLLEVCHAKLLIEGTIENGTGIEPVALHFSLLGQSVPVIPWTRKHEIALQSSSLILLLHKLGFHLANDVGKLYPRIPHFWTSDVLYCMAGKLGPIGKTKFDVEKISDLPTPSPAIVHKKPIFVLNENFGSDMFESNPCPPTNWMSLVQKSKTFGTNFDEEHMDECASLTALPPTEVSENVSMMSDEEDPCDL